MKVSMKMFLSIIGALGVTTALILLMNGLIGDPEKLVEPAREPEKVVVDFHHKKDPPPNRNPVEPQPPAVEPSLNSNAITIATSEIDSPVITFEQVDLVNPQSMDLPQTLGQNIMQESDRSAMPMYQAHPRYPMEAQLKGIEGYVVLLFDVDKAGAANNIQIVEAKPRRIFDTEAKRALKKWKFKPALEDGKEVEVKGERARLEFNLPEEVAKN